MNDRALKTERHCALNVVYANPPILLTNQPSASIWTLNDFIVALILVGVMAAIALGVL
jgi:hypothetical protein